MVTAPLLTTSDGEHTENPRRYREAQAKLRLKQREFGRVGQHRY